MNCAIIFALGGMCMNREVLKQRAKFKTQNNYWKSVLVAFVLSLMTGGASAGAGANLTINIDNGNVTYENTYGYNYTLSNHFWPVFIVTFIIVFLAVFVITNILQIFIFNPLTVGAHRFFLENVFHPAEPGRLGFVFQNGQYKNVVFVMFWRQLSIFLWSLLFLIPGIIKTYEYFVVPYLLADAPDLSKEDALRISREMMDGHKMEAFILELSFFGWYLLNTCTCGLLGIFYINPYVQATFAEFFVELRNNYFNMQQQYHQQ